MLGSGAPELSLEVPQLDHRQLLLLARDVDERGECLGRQLGEHHAVTDARHGLLRDPCARG